MKKLFLILFLLLPTLSVAREPDRYYYDHPKLEQYLEERKATRKVERALERKFHQRLEVRDIMILTDDYIVGKVLINHNWKSFSYFYGRLTIYD